MRAIARFLRSGWVIGLLGLWRTRRRADSQ